VKGINRFPEGLLALLDLKSRGNTPSDLSDVVQPGLDMLPFYELGQQLQWVNANAAAAVGPAVAPVTVPDGEVWLVRQATLTIEALAGGTLYGALVSGPANTFAQYQAIARLPNPWTATAVAQGDVLTWQPQTPFLARSGYVFAARFFSITGGGFTVLTSVQRTVYRA
jgi:hypothetical protein